MNFSKLAIGDMFNVKSGRFVKIEEDKGICVMSTIIKVGDICEFFQKQTVIPLYMAANDF